MSKRGLQASSASAKPRQPCKFSELIDMANATIFTEENLIQASSVLWESINSPVSLGLYLRVKYGDLLGCLSKEIDPHDYLDADTFLKDLQAVKFLTKSELTVDGVDRKATALRNHDEAELSCLESNTRIRVAQTSDKEFLRKVRQSVSSILGPFPGPQAWEEACRFSAGSTAGGRAYLSDKLHRPTVTDQFYTLGSALVSNWPAWKRECTISVLPGEAFSLVPKSWKTDRDIGIQPSLNIYAQLGLGGLIRQRLKRAGCDLDHGWKVNQSRARVGSIDNSLATLDLKNASNSLCIELVQATLPADWFHALLSCRCDTQVIEGSTRKLNRFSAMGNGYTFELESLLFLCICRVCLNDLGIPRREVSVFGDDIIVPNSCAKAVTERLAFCGFTVNEKKSFQTSYFRESCGAQFFNGRDVRPVQAKYGKRIHHVPFLVALANGLRRASCRFGFNGHSDNIYRATWVRLIKRIPIRLRSSIAVTTDSGDDRRLLVDEGCTWLDANAWHRWNRQLQRVETPALTITQYYRAIYRWDTRLLLNLFLMEERSKQLRDSTVLSEVCPISSSKELKKLGKTAIRLRFEILEPHPDVSPF